MKYILLSMLLFPVVVGFSQLSKYSTVVKDTKIVLLIYKHSYVMFLRSMGRGDFVSKFPFSSGTVRFNGSNLDLTDYNGGVFSFVNKGNQGLECRSGALFLKRSQLKMEKYNEEDKDEMIQEFFPITDIPVFDDSALIMDALARYHEAQRPYIDTTYHAFYGAYCSGLPPKTENGDCFLVSGSRYQWYFLDELVSGGTWQQKNDTILLKDENFNCVFQLKKKDNLLKVIKLLQLGGDYIRVKR